MARAGFKVTVRQTLADGHTAVQVGRCADPATDTLDTLQAAAVVIGVGNASTQIAAVGTEITRLETALNGHVVLTWDTTTVTTKNQLRSALRGILHALQGDGSLTGP